MAGATLCYRIQVSTFDAACRNVAAGLGIAIVPLEVAAAFALTLGLRLLPLSDKWSERRFVICMRRRESVTPVARLLIDHLHERAVANVGANPAASAVKRRHGRRKQSSRRKS